MKKILDIYFRWPVLIDYLLSLGIIATLFYFVHKKNWVIPQSEKIYSLSSDIGTIGLTISGFILTLLTILITMKSGEDSNPIPIKKDSPAVRVFFASSLYFKSIKLLKHAVISLVTISIINYFTKILISANKIEFLFYLNITGLIIVLTTFLRCIFILSKIVAIQRH